MKKYFVNLFLLLLSNFLFGQVEYFVRVNPATCSYAIIDSLLGVKWIAGGSADFDKINKKYIFDGQDINHNDYLYTIDAVNGNIISNPPWTNFFSLLKFDNATGILYGLHWSTALTNADFVSVNPTNLNYTIIHHINVTGLTGNVTFDDINHRFIFIANDSVGNNCLFCINAITGNVISKPTLSNGISGIQFDNSSGNLYGLKWDNSLQTENFVSINIVNGNASIISSIPLIDVNCNSSTFDEINKRYTFVWTDNNTNNYLYTINAITGLVISNPPFPVFVSPYNLLEFRYDNSSGNLYALHWGPHSETTGVTETRNQNLEIKIYPNPVQQYFNIELPHQQNFNLFVYDVTGRKVYQRTNATGIVNIDCSGFTSGIYFVQAMNEKNSLSCKLIKQ